MYYKLHNKIVIVVVLNNYLLGSFFLMRKNIFYVCPYSTFEFFCLFYYFEVGKKN